MKKIWKFVSERKIAEERKYQLFLFLNSILFAVIGLGVWFIVSMFALCTLEWAICFTGYSGFFFGFVGGFFFLCQQE